MTNVKKNLTKAIERDAYVRATVLERILANRDNLNSLKHRHYIIGVDLSKPSDHPGEYSLQEIVEKFHPYNCLGRLVLNIQKDAVVAESLWTNSFIIDLSIDEARDIVGHMDNCETYKIIGAESYMLMRTGINDKSHLRLELNRLMARPAYDSLFGMLNPDDFGAEVDLELNRRIISLMVDDIITGGDSLSFEIELDKTMFPKITTGTAIALGLLL